MFSDKFLKFIEIWQNDFAIERSIDENVCVDKDGKPLPWYTYPAIEYLAQFDYHDKNVFEFGCGYSSLFWAARAESVISVEDNPHWLEKWQTEFSTAQNLKLMFAEEGKAYYNAIFDEQRKYDVIVIDGKCRAECATTAVQNLNDGGIIILDDSDRVNTSAEYVEAIRTLKNAGLLQVDFYGFCPMNNYTKTTSLFLCRNFNFASVHEVQPINGIGNLWHRPRKDRKDFYKSNK